MSHQTIKYIAYVATLAFAIMLTITPDIRELFTDTIWLIVYYLVLFSYLLFSLHYGN